ncbi:MAG TPA: amidohydrolase family protein [Rhizomicrobium sp.]|nr:amidohydrolase family protein [Rhizomicrobium sp.]
MSAADHLLRPSHVWTDGAMHDGCSVLVRGKRIAAVGPNIEAGNARAVDLPGLTLLPGLMDLHSHLFLHPYNETPWDDQVLKESEAYRTVRAVTHAAATLRAGFTTLRDLGTEGAGHADVAVKRAIEEGIVPGPRLFVVTRAIVATGSYGPARAKFRPDCCFPQGAEEASGIDEVMRAVRQQASHGADWIKVYADYRAGPGGETVATFSIDELKALVDTAHSLGRPVAAHATSDEGMRRAAIAGVDTIEHGYGGSRETFALMRKNNIAYLPTLTVCEALCEYFQGHVRGGEPHPRMTEAANAFRTAREEGVVIGCGSDVGPFPHGENLRELRWMEKLGMSRDEALLAATSVNAKILRREYDLGSVKVDYLADLIAVDGDPSRDLGALADPRFVMANGALYKALM